MSPTELQLLIDNITEAQSAYHELMTGRAARIVIDQNGERVEFVAANRQALYLYIQSLKAQLPTELQIIPRTTGPLGFMF